MIPTLRSIAFSILFISLFCEQGVAGPQRKAVSANALLGGLSVTLVNGEGWPGPGSNAEVRLFDNTGKLVAVQNPSTSSVASFSGVQAGSGYSYTVIETPPGNTSFTRLYWGQKVGVTISDGSVTNETFDRNTPYGLDIHTYDTLTNQSVAGKTVLANTGLRSEFTIKNPSASGSFSRTVRAALIYDRDKLTPYDLYLVSPYITLTPGESRVVKLPFTPSAGGGYYMVGSVLADSLGQEVTTDGGTWQGSIEFTVQQSGGDLTVAVSNAEGWSGPNDRGKVTLFDANGNFLTEQMTNSSGVASFLAIPAANNYSYTVNEVSITNAPFTTAFWGTKTNVIVIGGWATTSQFTRNSPYGLEIHTYDTVSNQSVAGMTIPTGTGLRVEFTVKNSSYPGAYTRNVRTLVILDRDKSEPYDAVIYSPPQSLAVGKVAVFNSRYTPPAAGDYFVVAAVLSDSSGQEVVTDSGTWPDQADFTVKTGGNGTLVVTLQDAENWGPAGTGARVELFNSGGSKVAQAISNSSSVVTFTDIPEGTGYYYRVYVNRQTPWGELFWGEETGITIIANQSTAIVHTHNTPYILGFSVHIDGSDVTLPDGGRRAIEPGTRLRFDLQIKNPTYEGAQTVAAYGELNLDRDKAAPYDMILSDSASSYIAGTTRTASIYYTPMVAGDYYVSTGVFASSSRYGTSVTDGSGWREPAFSVGSSEIVVLSTHSLELGRVPLGKSSPAQSFQVSAGNLTSDLDITAPACLQVSTENSTFSSSVTLTQAGGRIPPTLVYVRFSPTAPGAYCGQVDYRTSKTMGNITVSGTGVALVPIINIVPSLLIISQPAGLPASGTVTHRESDRLLAKPRGSPPTEEHSYGLIVPKAVEEYWRIHRPQIEYSVATLASSIDWSMYDSPVKDQRSCGSCWAFAATALVENLSRVADLSEQVIVSCSGAGDCQGGWTPDALTYVRMTGIPPEACYPYTGTYGSCQNKCPSPDFLVKVAQSTGGECLWGSPAKLDDIKAAMQKGPLAVGMNVFSDFDSYEGGIYHHTSGSLRAGHEVLVVAYDDAGRYFTAKNSWGPAWGEAGYFRISYDDVTNEVSFGSWAATASGVYIMGRTNTCTIQNVGGAPLTVNSIIDNKNWLSTTGYPTPPFSVQPLDSQTIMVNVDWNQFSDSMDVGTITIASNDLDKPTANVSVTANEPTTAVLAVRPDNFPADYGSGTFEGFKVSNAGNGTLSYTATVTTGGAWLSITGGGTGGNNGTITARYLQNNGAQRVGTIRVSASNALGSPKDVTVTQAAGGPKGSIIIATKNAEGWGGPRTEGRVTLFSPAGGFVAQQSADTTGVSVFSSVPVGTGYSYTVNQVRPENAAIPHLYWGKKSGISIAAAATTTESFTRNAPYNLEWHIYDTTTNQSVYTATVGRGTGLRSEVIVRNPSYSGSLARTVRSSLILGRDKVPPYDLVISSSNALLGVGATRTDKMYFTLNANGSYFVTSVEYADSNGQEVETDGEPWSTTPFLTVTDPAFPIPLAPPHMTAGLDTPVTVLWTRAAGASSFHLQVGCDSAFTPGLILHDFPTVDTFAVLHSLSFLTSYWWHVNAYSPATGISAFSSPWQFSTGLSLPGTITLVDPSQNAVVNADTLLLRWKATEPQVDRYWLEYSVDSVFTLKAIDSLLLDTTAVIRNMIKSMEYFWRVRAHNFSGWGPYSSTGRFLRSLTAVNAMPQGIPSDWVLMQNFPNPFNPSTTIIFGLPQRAQVRVTVYNTLGEAMSELVNGDLEAGYHEVKFEGNGLSSGMYFYRIEAGSFVETRKFVLLR